MVTEIELSPETMSPDGAFYCTMPVLAELAEVVPLASPFMFQYSFFNMYRKHFALGHGLCGLAVT